MRATFDCATIQDVVAKAAKVAPTKGAAFSQAAGLLIQLRPNQEPNCIIKATDTSVWYTEMTDAEEITGFDDADWRVGAQLLAMLLKTFPTAAGATCSFEIDPKFPGMLTIKCQKSVTRLNLLDPNLYPKWEMFDPSGLLEAKDFASRMAQVGWAVAPNASGTDSIPMSGVYVDGQALYATDRTRLARVPCEVPIDTPVIVPPALVAPVLKNTSDVKIGVAEGKFYMMPDEATQIVANTINANYPNVQRVMAVEPPNFISVSAQQLKGMIDRMMLMAGSDRFPRLDLVIGDEVLRLRLSVEGAADCTDELELDGQATHDPFTIYYTPKILASCLAACPTDGIRIGYHAGQGKRPFYIDGGLGFQSWAMPRTPGQQDA